MTITCLEAMMPKTNLSLEERFWKKVARRGDDECWEWTAYRNACGYGMFKTPARVHLAHRVAYEFVRGPIPDGRELDHLCRNRACVNPAHLEAVEHATNVQRGVRRVVTHCKHGHPFDAANTYVTRAGKRACKACVKRHHEAWVAKGGLARWKEQRASRTG